MMLKPALRPPLRAPMRGATTLREGGGAYHALAQKLLARRAATPYGGNMPSPPTVTVGSSDGASTVATGRGGTNPTTLLNSANLTQVSGNNITSGGVNYSAGYVNTGTGSTLTAAKGWGVRFTIPVGATMFDVSTRNLASASGWRVRINGLWVQDADFTSGTVQDGAHYYYTKFSPVTAGDLIEIYFGDGAQVPGINCGTGAASGIQTVAAPEVDPIKVTVFGDSYVYGSGPTSNVARGAWPHKLAEKWGVPNLINSGVGGTGLVATNGGASKAFNSRIADITRVNTPDIVIVPGSLNDNGQSATLEAAATTFFTALGAAAPNALIICLGIEHSPSNNPSSSYDALMAAGFAAAGLGTRGKFFPTLNGSYQDTTDSSLYNADNVHMSNAGTARYAAAADADIAAWLATL